ncbi:MAG: glycosyltransferase family 4 protein [Desulfobulbaceae bacterium]|nr:glycosyltransferase family 4 protein [Desulfobulbaceae bacterium]
MVEAENEELVIPASKKVLLIAPQPFFEERGTPMNVRLMASILGQKGYLVDLVVFPTGEKICIPGVNLIILPNILRVNHIPIGFSLKKLFFDFLMFFWCTWFCLRNEYVVIHGVEEGGFLAVLLGKISRKSTVYDMDSVMSEQVKSRGYQAVIKKLILFCEKWSVKNASVVITVCSALTKRAYLERNAAVVQIEDIPLEFAFPVEESLKLKNDLLVESIVRELGFFGKKILLYTGNLQKYQGIDLLLEAWQVFIEMGKEYKEYRLVIVGGPDNLKCSYEQQGQRGVWQQSVAFVGQRPADEMSSWMALAEGLVSPRKEGENTPLKIYTYMASGKPIIATDKLTHTQVLTQDMAFLTVPEKGAMAKAIQRLFLDENEACKRGREAFNVVQSKYSYEVFAQKLERAYSLAIKER